MVKITETDLNTKKQKELKGASINICPNCQRELYVRVNISNRTSICNQCKKYYIEHY